MRLLNRNLGIALLLNIFLILPVYSESVKPIYSVAFWNVENLFDPVNDPLKNDNDFTPDGRMLYTYSVMSHKMEQLTKITVRLGENGHPDIFGLAEIENRKVMEIWSQHYMPEANYGIIHHESPDERGIDVALFYKKDLFRVGQIEVLKVEIGDDKTRDILIAELIPILPNKTSNARLYISINHWTSRIGGQEITEPKRITAAKTLRNWIDNKLSENPDADILIMGDFNDTASNRSIREVLFSRCYSIITDKPLNSIPLDLLINMTEHFDMKPNRGSYKFRGEWETIDQIIISSGLLLDSGFRIIPDSVDIFLEPDMLQGPEQGRFAGYPFRYWAGTRVLGGFSDHLPLIANIELRQ